MDAHVHSIKDAIPGWGPSVALPEPEPLPPIPVLSTPGRETRRLVRLDRFIARQRHHNLRDALLAVMMAVTLSVTVFGLL